MRIHIHMLYIQYTNTLLYDTLGTLLGTLETIGQVAVTHKAKAPATIVIGEVVHVLGPV